MTPHPPVQIPCLIWGDAGVTMLGDHAQATGTVIKMRRIIPGGYAAGTGGNGPSRREAVALPDP